MITASRIARTLSSDRYLGDARRDVSPDIGIRHSARSRQAKEKAPGHEIASGPTSRSWPHELFPHVIELRDARNPEERRDEHMSRRFRRRAL